MSNHFSCNLFTPDFSADRNLAPPYYLGLNLTRIRAYSFFYCAQPNATSASIQGVTTNLREYYVKHLKLDYCLSYDSQRKMCCMFFVLNVPQDYVPSTGDVYFDLRWLPNHAIPENVLYYDLIEIPYHGQHKSIRNISIDIKKPFRVLPSYKLSFVYYTFNRGNTYEENPGGTVQIDFAVN